MDKTSQNHHLRMSFNSLKLPRIPTSLSQPRSVPSDSDDHLIPGRRSFMLNPYGIPSSTPLKLPKLLISPSVPEKVNNSGESGRAKERITTTLLPSISIKLTKHEKLQKETASTRKINSQMDRLNMDFDRKLSSVQQSMQNFHKKFSSVKTTMHEAVRRSISDAARNKAVNSRRLVTDRMGMDSYEEKCVGIRQPVQLRTEQSAAGETVTSGPVNKRLTQIQKATDFRSPTPMILTKKKEARTGESCAEFGDHFTSCSIQGSGRGPSNSSSQSQPQPEEVYDEDKPSPSLEPIMENLSDKAFLTKLKIKDGHANRTMQKMQNRANAIQDQVQHDKLKAKLETKSEKRLYKPRKEHLPQTTEARHELMGFLQSNGGATGKWNSADHNKFLKIYQAWKGVPELIIETCIEEFRHKTAAECMAHAEWYEEYEELIESNKNQVRKWDEGKRKEREMIYQMAAQARKTKLEDEKRRKEHLKSIRNQERQKARVGASKWKDLKNKSDAINAEPVEIDATGITQEMLTLAHRVQSLTSTSRKSMPPHLRNFSAKTSINSHTITPDLGTPLKVSGRKGSKTAPPAKRRVKRIKLPPLNVNSQRDDDNMESDCIQDQNSQEFNRGEGDFDHSIISDKDDSSYKKSVSNLQSETFSHKLRKEAQIIKRMEIQSLRGKIPHRVEQIQLQNVSLHPKKGTPKWKKIS